MASDSALHGTCFRRRLSTYHAGAAPCSTLAELADKGVMVQWRSVKGRSAGGFLRLGLVVAREADAHLAARASEVWVGFRAAFEDAGFAASGADGQEIGGNRRQSRALITRLASWSAGRGMVMRRSSLPRRWPLRQSIRSGVASGHDHVGAAQGQ